MHQTCLAPENASAAASVGDASAYLRLAASSATEAPLAELEVRDRHKAPPTKTIRSYLASHVIVAPSISLKEEQQVHTAYSTDAKLDTQRASSILFEAHDEPASVSSSSPEPDDEARQPAHLPVRLRPGPILIAWEAGKVATDEDSALCLLQELQEQAKRGNNEKLVDCRVC